MGGPPGTPNVAWGNFGNYLAYTAKLNPWFPRGWIPAIGWAATVCEVCFGLMLIIGYRTRLAAILSGFLTLAFAIGMVSGSGLQAPLNYSVFTGAGGAFLLANCERFPFTVDEILFRRTPGSGAV